MKMLTKEKREDIRKSHKWKLNKVSPETQTVIRAMASVESINKMHEEHNRHVDDVIAEVEKVCEEEFMQDMEKKLKNNKDYTYGSLKSFIEYHREQARKEVLEEVEKNIPECVGMSKYFMAGSNWACDLIRNRIQQLKGDQK